jgi:Holliday junction resolvase
MNAKRKGNQGENKFANWCREQGLEVWRNSGSGSGIAKSDANNSLGINFEIKTVKALNLKKAWKQSERDANMTHSIPYVVVHFDGMGDNEWLIVMDNYNWLELMKNKPGVITNPLETNRNLKWKVEKLKQAANDVIKELE